MHTPPQSIYFSHSLIVFIFSPFEGGGGDMFPRVPYSYYNDAPNSLGSPEVSTLLSILKAFAQIKVLRVKFLL